MPKDWKVDLPKLNVPTAERALRASALLLDWVSEGGNRPMNADVAIGIAAVLDFTADRIKRDQRYQERRRS